MLDLLLRSAQENSGGHEGKERL